MLVTVETSPALSSSDSSSFRPSLDAERPKFILHLLQLLNLSRTMWSSELLLLLCSSLPPIRGNGVEQSSWEILTEGTPPLVRGLHKTLSQVPSILPR